jgi:hypothetical protein
MKITLFYLLISLPAWGQYTKPKMLARFAPQAFNAPDGSFCFGSEPLLAADGLYLGCQSDKGYSMLRWRPEFEEIIHSQHGYFSHPLEVRGVVSWYEFDVNGPKVLFETTNGKLTTAELKKLGNSFARADAFTPIKNNSYVYRLQGEDKTLNLWRNHEVSHLFEKNVSHIFPPVSSWEGHFLIKVRENHLNENAPDELLLWDGKFKSVLKDKDADPSSPWLSFRHQYALDGSAIAFIARDEKGEGLFILNDRLTEVARTGREVLSFDYFSPKMRNGVLVFRGVDHQKRKAVWVFSNGKLSRLLTQGDTVLTDKGVAQVNYQSQDAIFYGAPTVGAYGEIVLQATLTDKESDSLLGIGLLKFSRE